MLKKFANSEITLTQDNQLQPEKALSSPEITDRFKKLAHEIKKVAPRSQDFLYFIARGIHAMEHAAIDPIKRQYSPQIGHIAHDNGTGHCKSCEGLSQQTSLLKTSRGEPISGLWCPASSVEPWINQNGDAFPECELLMDLEDPKNPGKTIKAYQTFIGRGLFTDHKSSEVENIRGIILDAEYDHETKGVDLLIALDKINYPELARQVSAGYSTSVSMGTQVGYSLCSLCGNKAVTEHDYCTHVSSGKGIQRAGSPRCYEVNNALNFIELSMVGNAADPRARIRTIVAQAKDIKKNLEANLQSNMTESENRLILDSISRLEQQVGDLSVQMDNTSIESKIQEQAFTGELLNKVAQLESQIKEIGGRFMAQKTQEKKAYMQGTVEPDLGKPFEMADKNYKQYWETDIDQTGQDQTNGKEGLHGGYGLGSDEEVKKMYHRANTEQRKKMRKALLEKVSYMQGTVEPDLAKPFEMSDKNYKKYWEEDVAQSGPDQTNGPTGTHPGYGLGSDEQVKKDLLRAKLRAKLEKFANPAKNKWTVFAGDQQVLSVSAEEAYGLELSTVAEALEDQTNQQWFDSRNYGINLIQAVKKLGLEKVAGQIQKARRVNAQAAPAAVAPAEEAQGTIVDSPEGPETEAAEMQSAEGIRGAAERIESAKDEILSLVENLEGMHAEEGTELASDLGAAGEELGELGSEMGAASEMPPAQASAYRRLVRYALNHADSVLAEAEAFVERVVDEDGEITTAAKKKDTKKKGKLPPWLMKKDDKKDDKKKDKKAFSDEELRLRKEARHAYAQQLYNLTEGDMIAEAHPEGGNTTTFPGQDEGRIETETEAQEKDEQVANSTPRGELVARRNYRTRLIQAAERAVKADAVSDAQNVVSTRQQDLATMTKSKTQAVTDAQRLLAQKQKEQADAAAKQTPTTTTSSSKAKTAEVDSETKQYYKEEGAQSATGQKPDKEVASFYNDLTSDFSKKKSTAAVHDFGLKMKRAYHIAMKRASLGQIESSQDALDADVDRLMNLDDDSFVAFADVVENTRKVKTAFTAPTKQVRTAGALNVGVSESAPQSVTLTDQLNKLPWK
jgi:hypothetical protein